MLDVLIGLAVFAIIVSGIIYAMLFSQQGILRSGDHIRAVFLNQKAIAAVKSMRDRDVSLLTEGAYGITLGVSGMWEFSGSGTVSSDGYVTTVTVEPLDGENYRVAATTSWEHPIAGSGSITLTTDITDWHRVKIASNWSSIALDGAYVDDGTPLFNAAAVQVSFAFVTSETSDGGNGLYVFDISDTSAPTRVAETFDLGAPGYDVLIVGDTLFVVTGDASAEVRIFDITDPSSFDAGDLIGTINIPGSSNARAIMYYDGTLFVVGREDVSASEIFAYDVSDIGSITLLSDLDDPGASFTDIRLLSSYAYVGSSADTREIRVIDVFDPADLQFAPGNGYNLPDTPDATSVVAFGGYVLVGRNQGDVTEEWHLFDVSESPVPPVAPFNAEAGANVNALDFEPTGTYVFSATNHDGQELVVLDVDIFAGGGNPIVETYDTITGFGRGVHYDAIHDRVLLLTNTAFIILRP